MKRKDIFSRHSHGKSKDFLKFFSWPWLSFFLLALVMGLFFIRIGPLFQRVLSAFQVNQGEAINVEFARNLLRDGNLYPDPVLGPYLYSAYPPLFPVLQTFLMKCFPNPWLSARLLAFAGYLGCAVTMALWGWFRWEKTWALIIPLLLLLSPTWAFWGAMGRVDELMILCEFSAFLLLMTSRQRPGMTLVFMAGALTAVAIALKQNAILLVIAYGLTCFREKRMKDFLTFGLGFLIPTLLFFGYWEIKTSGFFFKYILLWSPLGFDPRLLFHYLWTSFLPECGWLLLLAGFAWRYYESPFLVKAQWVISGFWVLGLGRQGSAENYYLEFILFSLFLVGDGYFRNKNHKAAVGFRPYLLLILLVGLLLMTQKPWPVPPSREECTMKAAALQFHQADGEYLALDLDLPLMAGKRLWVQPLEYTWMVEKGVWSAEPLLKNIRDKKFSTVELYDLPEQYMLPKRVVSEIQRNYHVKTREFGRLWLVPNR